MSPYQSIQDPAKLRRVLESILLLAADLELPILLRHVVEEACAITNARYGALGVLNGDGTALAQFVTTGLDADEERRIGPRPTGRGVLGLLISDPRPVRVADIATHPESSGFPPNHPAMHSFLGVPVMVRDQVYGNLYLTEKTGWSEFTEDDEALVSALAVGAGIAIQNARLHERAREVVVFEERDRLARDLHDTVIQRLFAIGLSVQSLVADPTAPAVADRLQRAVDDLDATIRQIRASIFQLTSSEPAIGSGMRTLLVELARELEPVIGFEVHVLFDGPVDTSIDASLAEHVVAVAREALTNVARHAQATEATLSLHVVGDRCRLEVIDNGRGFDRAGDGDGDGDDDRATAHGGLGLANLRRRAEKLRGELRIDSSGDRGTTLVWEAGIGAA